MGAGSGTRSLQGPLCSQTLGSRDSLDWGGAKRGDLTLGQPAPHDLMSRGCGMDHQGGL